MPTSRPTCRGLAIFSRCSILTKVATADRLTETLDCARGARSGRFFWGALPIHEIVIAPQHRRNLVPVPCAATMYAYYPSGGSRKGPFRDESFERALVPGAL